MCKPATLIGIPIRRSPTGERGYKCQHLDKIITVLDKPFVIAPFYNCLIKYSIFFEMSTQSPYLVSLSAL